MRKNNYEQTFQLQPIGRVSVNEANGRYLLEIDPPYREALQQLDRFSHVLVFWWADQMDNDAQRKILTTELPYAPGESVGVFACRSEYRPNPIAVTTVPILHLDVAAGQVTLPWIDAYDSSPLLDVKPYIPICDRIRDLHVAPWMAEWPMWMEDAPAYFAAHETDFGD
jgi:tRNA (adenine37-N6)-methyltransferase